jgi:5'-methylthioadenosine phosphorylase
MRIGVIGGSGLYEMQGLESVREERVTTPFGDPSDALIHGRLGDAEMVFLPRHGRGHRFNPSQVNYRANIYAMKMAGVEWIISVSAVGSLREEIVPGHIVVIDQFIDKTFMRKQTFFDSGIVAHVAFGDPVCPTLRRYLLESCVEAGATFHDGGTYVCMEGPAFSTRAESNLHRSWGASVIGMTNLPEAKLAREAEISYATLAMATDYDCWHPHHDDVTVDQVVAVLHANATLAKQVVRAAVPRILAHQGPAPQSSALATSILTPASAVSADARRALAPLIGKYMPA